MGCLLLRVPPRDRESEREESCVPTPVVTAKSAEAFDSAGVVWGCGVSRRRKSAQEIEKKEFECSGE